MLLEHKDSIRVLCHSWGTKPIMEGSEVKGVIFESKEGRKAVMAKGLLSTPPVTGDLFSQTGTPFASLADGATRSSTTALVWRIGGIKLGSVLRSGKRSRPKEAAQLRAQLSKIAGFNSMPLPTNQNDMCWVNNWHAGKGLHHNKRSDSDGNEHSRHNA